MLRATVIGQTLKVLTPKIVSGNYSYLTATIGFSLDWKDAKKYAHFKQGETAYDVEIVDGKITEEDRLALSTGSWSLWISGMEVDPDGVITKQITTNEVTLVSESTGEGFPSLQPSIVEQGIADMQVLEASAAASATSASAYAQTASDAAEAAEDARDKSQEYEETAKGYAEESKQAEGYAEKAEESADRAEQAAKTAGYMYFYNAEGRLHFMKTTNVETDFNITNGRLEVVIP